MYNDTRISLFECGVKKMALQGSIYELDDTKEVSRGGSCLVYHAIKKDAYKASRDRKVMIKEFYPYHKDSKTWRKEDGRLVLPEDNEEIENRKRLFEKSYDCFTELYDQEMDNNMVRPDAIGNATMIRSDTTSNTAMGNSVYMVVDYSSGITLDMYMEKTGLFEFFTVMKNLAGVLGALHKRGYIHMDVKPSNILCLAINPQHPNIREMTRLLDTDSFIEKANFLNIMKENGLAGSPGYIAPEVAELREDTDDIDDFFDINDFEKDGECADMFSFGVIIYKYIFKQLPEAPYEICHTYEENLKERLEECQQEKFRYIPYKAVCLIRNLLRTTLARSPIDRYENMSQIEDEIVKILTLIDRRIVMSQ